MRTGINRRHCQCRAKCATQKSQRKCGSSCSHADRYQVRKTIDGKQRGRWFDTYAQAERYLITLEASLSDGGSDDLRPFNEVAEEWLATTAIDIAASTREKYERDLHNHLIPVFEDRPVGEITQSEVQALVNAWNVDHAPQTVRNRVNVLLPILRHGGNTLTVGKRNGGVNLPKQKSRSGDPTINARKYLEDATELKLLTDAMPARYRVFTVFLATVGCRPGEALELRQSDLINGQRLQISRAVKRVAKTVDPTGYRIGDTKTHQSRVVWCPPRLMDELRDESAPADRLLFSGDDGQWLDYNAYSKAFRKARRALPARLSSLRYTTCVIPLRASL